MIPLTFTVTFADLLLLALAYFGFLTIIAAIGAGIFASIIIVQVRNSINSVITTSIREGSESFDAKASRISGLLDQVNQIVKTFKSG